MSLLWVSILELERGEVPRGRTSLSFVPERQRDSYQTGKAGLVITMAIFL